MPGCGRLFEIHLISYQFLGKNMIGLGLSVCFYSR
nr:MAG TPA: BolA family protein [Inoviridae sp.]